MTRLDWDWYNVYRRQHIPTKRQVSLAMIATTFGQNLWQGIKQLLSPTSVQFTKKKKHNSHLTGESYFSRHVMNRTGYAMSEVCFDDLCARTTVDAEVEGLATEGVHRVVDSDLT